MTDPIWTEGYDGTGRISNGLFHVAGAFEDGERLGSPFFVLRLCRTRLGRDERDRWRTEDSQGSDSSRPAFAERLRRPRRIVAAAIVRS